jgi:hypothetical protein
MALTMDPLNIILIGLVAAATTEILAWVFVYRTSAYRRLKDELDRSCRKLEAIKQSSSGGVAPAASSKADKGNKKEKRIEDNIRSSSKEMGNARFKANIFTGAVMLLVYNLIIPRWDGVVIAKLPFSPPSFLQTITHRGLPGDLATDCSAAFVYAMAFAFFKQNVSKALGFTLSRSANRALMANNPITNVEQAAKKYQ